MRNFLFAALLLTSVLGTDGVWVQASDEPRLTEDEFETLLHLRVTKAVLEAAYQSGRAVPAFRGSFRSVDARLMADLDPAARQLLPEKDAWGTRLRVMYQRGD